MSSGGGQEKSAFGGYPPDLRRRLLLLRREHPGAEIDVELIRADDSIVVVKASIRWPDGGSVSSLGVVSDEPPEIAIGEAEQRALERALAIAISSPPIEEPVRPVAPTPITNRQPTPAPAERRAPAPIRTNAPIDIAAGRTPAPSPVRPVQEPEGEPPLSDFSWTAFWNWARENGFSKQADIVAVIGRTYEDLTPSEVRKLIAEKQNN